VSNLLQEQQFLRNKVEATKMRLQATTQKPAQKQTLFNKDDESLLDMQLETAEKQVKLYER
jgi:hypothetical protein